MLPTIITGNSPNEKTGILDVRVLMADGTQFDLEMQIAYFLELQILELQKLPKDVQTGNELVNWMKFFKTQKREEFALMAQKNEYMNEAYQTLLEISADEKKRLEYEAREKAIRDYNSQINSARKRGEKIGEERGEKRGRKIGEEQGRKIAETTRQVFCCISMAKNRKRLQRSVICRLIKSERF